MILAAIGAAAFTLGGCRSCLVWRVYAFLQPALGFPFFYDAVSNAGIAGERIFVVAAAAGTLARHAFLKRPWRAAVQGPLIVLLLLQTFGTAILAQTRSADWTALLQSLLRASVFICVVVVIRNEGDVRSIIHAGALSSIATACCSVLFLIFVADMSALRGRTFIDLYAKDAVPPSFFDGLARAGAGNMLGLVLAISFWRDQKDRLRRTLALAGACLVAVMLVAPLRREVFLITPVALSVWFALKRRSGLMFCVIFLRSLVLLFLVAVAVGMILVKTSPAWEDRLLNETVIEIRSGTIDPRVQLLLMTPSAVADAPWLGHGIGRYPQVTLRYYPDMPAYRANEGIAPHNGWSKIAVENGIPAFLMFTYFLAAIGMGILRRFQQSRTDLIKVGFVLFVVLCLQNFFGSMVDSTPWWFWLAVTASLVPRSIAHSRPPILTRNQRLWSRLKALELSQRS